MSEAEIKTLQRELEKMQSQHKDLLKSVNQVDKRLESVQVTLEAVSKQLDAQAKTNGELYDRNRSIELDMARVKMQFQLLGAVLSIVLAGVVAYLVK